MTHPIFAAFQRRLPLPRDPVQALVRAAHTGRVAAWAARFPEPDPTLHDALARAVHAHVDRLDAEALQALIGHPLAPVFAQRPLLSAALQARDRAAIAAITAGPWLGLAPFAHSLMEALQAPPGFQEQASVAAAIAADATIASKDWAGYGAGLATALRHGHLGVLSWAQMSDLPVLDCPPVREQMTALYGTGLAEDAFRLALLIVRAKSNHQILRAQRFLAKAGDTPAQALFAPHTAFQQACNALPTVAPTLQRAPLPAHA